MKRGLHICLLINDYENEVFIKNLQNKKITGLNLVFSLQNLFHIISGLGKKQPFHIWVHLERSNTYDRNQGYKTIRTLMEFMKHKDIPDEIIRDILFISTSPPEVVVDNLNEGQGASLLKGFKLFDINVFSLEQIKGLPQPFYRDQFLKHKHQTKLNIKPGSPQLEYFKNMISPTIDLARLLKELKFSHSEYLLEDIQFSKGLQSYTLNFQSLTEKRLGKDIHLVRNPLINNDTLQSHYDYLQECFPHSRSLNIRGNISEDNPYMAFVTHHNKHPRLSEELFDLSPSVISSLFNNLFEKIQELYKVANPDYISKQNIPCPLYDPTSQLRPSIIYQKQLNKAILHLHGHISPYMELVREIGYDNLSPIYEFGKTMDNEIKFKGIHLSSQFKNDDIPFLNVHGNLETTCLHIGRDNQVEIEGFNSIDLFRPEHPYTDLASLCVDLELNLIPDFKVCDLHRAGIETWRNHQFKLMHIQDPQTCNAQNEFLGFKWASVVKDHALNNAFLGPSHNEILPLEQRNMHFNLMRLHHYLYHLALAEIKRYRREKITYIYLTIMDILHELTAE